MSQFVPTSTPILLFVRPRNSKNERSPFENNNADRHYDNNNKCNALLWLFSFFFLSTSIETTISTNRQTWKTENKQKFDKKKVTWAHFNTFDLKPDDVLFWVSIVFFLLFLGVFARNNICYIRTEQHLYTYTYARTATRCLINAIHEQ